MTAISIQDLSKHFGDTRAVDGITLTINDGELFFLLGPSGCGKTTLLRMIAGFIDPTGGDICFGDKKITTLPPHKRNTGMVFQSYALWPHMTVFDNVSYGLSVRKVAARERKARAEDALKLVQMESYGKRKPNELSGGQQQRVALARALVIKPSVLLLDEPLSNLDAKLRLEMRSEIRRICKESGITTIYVTHDQKEALSMADRVAVLREGKVVQEGPPRGLYQRPGSRFVAEFLGETNILEGKMGGLSGGGGEIMTCGVGLRCSVPDSFAVETGDQVRCSIRPEAIRMVTEPVGNNILRGRCLESIYLGEMAQHRIKIEEGPIIKILEINPAARNPAGDEVLLQIEVEDIVLLKE